MKIFAIIFSLVIGSYVHAAESKSIKSALNQQTATSVVTPQATGQTYFDRVSLAYSKAKPYDFKHASPTFLAGRCFQNTNGDKPIAAGLMIDDKIDSGVGPIAQPPRKVIGSIWSLSHPVDYFDDMTAYTARINYSNTLRDYEIDPSLGALKGLYDNGDSLSLLRMDQQYVYENFVTQKPNENFFCYYFKANR